MKILLILFEAILSKMSAYFNIPENLGYLSLNTAIGF